jgi:hypothetical protein
MRSSVDDPVTVRWASADVPAVVTDLDTHRGGGAEPGPEDLARGLVPEHHDQSAVGRIRGIDGPVEFG